MKRALTREPVDSCYYYMDGEKVVGIPNEINGDLSGISGNLSGISGNIDDCELTDSERVAGISINSLVNS